MRACRQAVVLADSYTRRMSPVTYSLPHALVPVANVPLIEYCLELLVSAGVAQVFIVVSEHTEVLQEYIDNSQSCQQFMEVQLIVAPGCKSPGQVSCIILSVRPAVARLPAEKNSRKSLES